MMILLWLLLTYFSSRVLYDLMLGHQRQAVMPLIVTLLFRVKLGNVARARTHGPTFATLGQVQQ